MKAEYLNSQEANENRQSSIDEKVKDDIRKYAEQGREAIDQRIKELDSSWDMERTLQLNAAILVLGGILLYKNNKKWAILSIFATAMLAQQAFAGNCGVFRFLNFFGMKSRKEIEREKFALKALRGDFDNIKNDIERAWEAVKDTGNKRPIGFFRENRD